MQDDKRRSHRAAEKARTPSSRNLARDHSLRPNHPAGEAFQFEASQASSMQQREGQEGGREPRSLRLMPATFDHG
jgi:hypothetical protein